MSRHRTERITEEESLELWRDACGGWSTSALALGAASTEVPVVRLAAPVGGAFPATRADSPGQRIGDQPRRRLPFNRKSDTPPPGLAGAGGERPKRRRGPTDAS